MHHREVQLLIRKMVGKVQLLLIRKMVGLQIHRMMVELKDQGIVIY